MIDQVRSFRPAIDVGSLLERAQSLDWIGTLGPQSDGGTATSARVFRMEDRDRTNVFGGTLRELLKEPGLPDVGDVEYVRAWGSSTPKGAPIDPHSHDGDWVLCLYLTAAFDAEPLEFVDGENVKAVHPEPGLALCWPSALTHRVRAGERAPGGDRIAIVFNLTLKRAA